MRVQPEATRLRRFPENCFAFTALLISVLLFIRGSGVSGMAAAVWGILYSCCVAVSQPEGRSRILINYAAALSGYSLSGHAIDSLRICDRSVELLEMDRIVFGESPAVAFQGINIRWLNELLSLSYLSYHVYLHWLLWEAIARPGSAINTMSRRVYGAFAVGLPMYLLLPAPSICYSFPELFTESVSGYWVTRMTQWLVANFAAKYDSFPSLHVFIMGAMVWFDPQRSGVRRKIMVPAYGLMVVSTILLRFHYGVDLLSGVVLLAVYVFITSRRTVNGAME